MKKFGRNTAEKRAKKDKGTSYDPDFFELAWLDEIDDYSKETQSNKSHHKAIEKQPAPLRSNLNNTSDAFHQYGIAPFYLASGFESVDVVVQLKSDYKNIDYAIVAMTNHPACYTTLLRKKKNDAVLRIVRNCTDGADGDDKEIHGIITWIAVGGGANHE